MGCSEKKNDPGPHAPGDTGRRYTEEYKATALDLALQRKAQGGSVRDLCEEAGHARASLDRWRVQGSQGGKPGPKGPAEELEKAMMQDIRNFDRQKRGTWGQGALYDAFGGTISKALIDRVLDERRKAKGKRRKTGRSVEFVSPGITYSTDFIYVSPRGRVLKTQDERARLVLGFKHQDHWPDADAAAFQAEIFKAHGAPYFFKHDRGSEFTGADFQWMLRQHKVISVPSPAHYPQFNGKMERGNQADRKWIAPTEANRPPLTRVMEELTQSTLDQNLARRRAPLGGRTAIEVWDHEKRVIVDRDALYFEWDKLRAEILARKLPNFDRRLSAEMEAMRLAAMVVVSTRGLVTYRWPEVPEVST